MPGIENAVKENDLAPQPTVSINKPLSLSLCSSDMPPLNHVRVVVAAILIFGVCGCFRVVNASCGSPNFSAPQAFNVRARGVAVADFNGDGKPDVVAAADFSSSVYLMINNGSQGFLPPVTFATGGWTGAVATGDFNDDQKVD